MNQRVDRSFAVVKMRLPYTDRRALSQAWFSALALAADGSTPPPALRSRDGITPPCGPAAAVAQPRETSGARAPESPAPCRDPNRTWQRYRLRRFGAPLSEQLGRCGGAKRLHESTQLSAVRHVAYGWAATADASNSYCGGKAKPCTSLPCARRAASTSFAARWRARRCTCGCEAKRCMQRCTPTRCRRDRCRASRSLRADRNPRCRCPRQRSRLVRFRITPTSRATCPRSRLRIRSPSRCPQGRTSRPRTPRAASATRVTERFTSPAANCKVPTAGPFSALRSAIARRSCRCASIRTICALGRVADARVDPTER